MLGARPTRRFPRLLCCAAAVAGLASSPARAAPRTPRSAGGAQGRASKATGPAAIVRRARSRLDHLLSKAPREGQLAPPLKKRVHAVMISFIDFGDLARRALGRHWSARSKAERSELVELLSGLIERNYVSEMRKARGYRLSIDGEEIDGDTAEVHTTARITTDGRTERVEITYRMTRGSGRWRVFDMVTDGVSVVRNYRSQFNRIIAKSGYEDLLARMRRKLERER